jgi:hypothetical protein
MRKLTSPQRDALARAFEMLDAPAPEMFRVAQAALDLLAEVAGDQPSARRGGHAVAGSDVSRGPGLRGSAPGR